MKYKLLGMILLFLVLWCLWIIFNNDSSITNTGQMSHIDNSQFNLK